MSSNLSCEIEVFGNVAVRHAQQVFGKIRITSGTFSLHDPTDGRGTVLSTSGHQVGNASLEALDGLTFIKGPQELLLVDDQLESLEFSREHFLGPVEGIHVARTEAVSVLVHIPVNTLELFGAGHVVGHLESFLLCDGAIIPESVVPVTNCSCDLELFGNHLDGSRLDLGEAHVGYLSEASETNRSHYDTKSHAY